MPAFRSRPRSCDHLVIGAEGGFTAAETSAAERAGYRALRLGPRVLRTESATVAALSTLQALWSDLVRGLAGGGRVYRVLGGTWASPAEFLPEGQRRFR